MAEGPRGSVYLNEEQSRELGSLFAQWEEAVETRSKINQVSTDLDSELSNVTSLHLDSENTYEIDTDSDEEDGEMYFFSEDTSGKAQDYRTLVLWVSSALRAITLLRRSIADSSVVTPVKERNLLKELVPPKLPEAKNIPKFSPDDLDDDQAVSEFVTALKRHRFAWRKILTAQRRKLRAGFDSEASLLKSIAKLSVIKARPLIDDYLQRDYTGARNSASIAHYKLQLIEELMDDTSAPSRPFLHTSLARLYTSFVETNSKVLDVITITRESKSCTLFDFRAFKAYEKVLNSLPNNTSLVVRCIMYLKKRLSPGQPEEWGYIPEGIAPRLLSIHLQWLSYVGGALDSKEVWKSAITLHLKCGHVAKARQLLETVQHLPLKNLREVLLLSEDALFQEHYPDFSIAPSVPTVLDLRIQRRQTFVTEAKKNKPTLNSTKEQLQSYYQLWRQECDAIVRDDRSLSSAQREQQWAVGFDFLLYIYQCAWTMFSQFANMMDYALQFARLYRDRLFALFDTIHARQEICFSADLQGTLETRLRQMALWLQWFSCFPNSPTVTLTIGSYLFSIVETLETPRYERARQILSKEERVSAVVQLLREDSIRKEPVAVSLLGALANAASPPSYEHLAAARTIFQSVAAHLLARLPQDGATQPLHKDNQPHARNLVKLWKSWAFTESRLMQYHTGVKRLQDALAHPLFGNSVELWCALAELFQEREKWNNVRVVYCHALCQIKQEEPMAEIWKAFLDFEHGHGGNPHMTLPSLLALAQQKVGSQHALSLPATVTASMEVDTNDEVVDMEISSPEDSSHTKSSPPPTTPQKEPASNSTPAAASTGKRPLAAWNGQEDGEHRDHKKQRVTPAAGDKGHSQLNQSLVQALVQSNPQSDASLLLLEQIQQELLRNKRLKATQSTPAPPMSPVVALASLTAQTASLPSLQEDPAPSSVSTKETEKAPEEITPTKAPVEKTPSPEPTPPALPTPPASPTPLDAPESPPRIPPTPEVSTKARRSSPPQTRPPRQERRESPPSPPPKPKGLRERDRSSSSERHRSSERTRRPPSISPYRERPPRRENSGRSSYPPSSSSHRRHRSDSSPRSSRSRESSEHRSYDPPPREREKSRGYRDTYSGRGAKRGASRSRGSFDSRRRGSRHSPSPYRERANKGSKYDDRRHNRMPSPPLPRLPDVGSRYGASASHGNSGYPPPPPQPSRSAPPPAPPHPLPSYGTTQPYVQAWNAAPTNTGYEDMDLSSELSSFSAEELSSLLDMGNQYLPSEPMPPQYGMPAPHYGVPVNPGPVQQVATFNPSQPSFNQHQFNMGTVDWNSLVRKVEVQRIVLSLHSLQNLLEENIARDRAKLEEAQRAEMQRIHKDNAEKLQNVRTPLEYGLVKNSNIDNLKKQRVFAQMQTDEFESNANQQRDNLRAQQQSMLQSAGVPGFFPTTEAEYIRVQSEIFNLLTRIAQAQCPA